MQRQPQTRRLTIALGLALTLGACSNVREESASSPARQDAPQSEPATRGIVAADAAANEVDALALSAPREREAKRESREGYMAPVPPPPAPAVHKPMPQSLAATAPVMRQNLATMPVVGWQQPANTEKYAHKDDNPVRRTSEDPVSTFSIDVDTGSYSNVRRMIVDGVRPPGDAVRAEEFINYFDYGHPAPASREVPFRVTTELAPAPWNSHRQLLMIGIKGYDVPSAALPPANLVFLIDTSGSMQSPDKLPLVRNSMRELVKRLRPQDRVSMVVYAGSAGLVLPPTSGAHQEDILAALDRLEAGGSTNGGDGIRLAYAMAKQAFVKDGVNRVILATDGDFNVGTVDQNALETLVADQRKSGIALTTLGFGSGNYNDQLAERLADVGDGNHAYIDSLQEARKVLVDAMGSTLLTIAKDVKIQIEFNPAVASEYRLIGYENRALNREDFANDKVDAGDIGAGHQVTALYEITPAGSGAERLPPLRYGNKERTSEGPAGKAQELAHLRLRYKLPGQDRSRLIETPVLRSQLVRTPSQSLRFASAVAAFADQLRGGKQIDAWGWNDILAAARQAKGVDASGQRAQFIGLVEQARRLTSGEQVAVDISE